MSTVPTELDLTDDAWLLLHEVRLRGMLDADDDPRAGDLESAGLVARKADFLVLTPAGREAHAVWARFPDDSEEREAARRAYENFLPMNQELLQVCHDWQITAGGAPNDHSDAAYDWGVIDRLTALDERAGSLVRRLGRKVERFGGYRPRLKDALRRVQDGENEWFASPRCDSYHTVWMQLHEDLLAAVGIGRDEEAEAAS